MSGRTLASLLTQLVTRLGEPGTMGRRQLTFTAMGGAYNRVAGDATAFAHRGERFLLEHIADAADPWAERSWAIAHADGSGRVYPNFPGPALGDLCGVWDPRLHFGPPRPPPSASRESHSRDGRLPSILRDRPDQGRRG
jgi:hypothetical protein